MASLLRFRRLQSDRRRRERPLDDRLQASEYPSFAGLVVLAGSKNPIPSRTRPLNSPAPMVLSPKTWKSRSLPGLPRTDIPLQRCSYSSSTMFLFLFNDVRSQTPCPQAAASPLAFMASGPAAQRRSALGRLPVIAFASVHGERIGSGGNHFSIRCQRVNNAAARYFSVRVRGGKGAAPLQICATSAAPPLEARAGITHGSDSIAIRKALRKVAPPARRIRHDRTGAVRDKMAPAGLAGSHSRGQSGRNQTTSPQTLRSEYEKTHTRAEKLKRPVANRGS